MSYFVSVLERSLASKDDEADIILAASPDGKAMPPTSAERKKITNYCKLSDAHSTVDIKARLAAYRECNTVVSKLASNADERSLTVNVTFRCSCPPRRDPPVLLSSESHSFCRIVQESAPVLPESDDVFSEIFAGQDTVKHPSGFSALTFSFANLISLCKIYPKYDNPEVNQTSGLLDLFPLYGLTDQDAKDTVRVIEPDEIGWGLLQADAYFEVGERLEFLPQATSILLILFNRNHNSIARRLLKENQQKRWVDPTTLEEESDEKQLQDDEIFALAKRVNCAVFRKIVTTDFLKGLLGLSPLDDVPAINLVNNDKNSNPDVNSVEFSILYSWLATLPENEVGTVKEALSQIDDPDTVTAEELDEFCSEYTNVADLERGTRPCAGLVREDGGKFNDTELAEVLHKATETMANAFRPRGTAELLAPLEVSGIERARKYKVCTLNKFRESLGLAPYKSFAEWCANVEVAQAAEKLYTKIDNLELYVGLRGEESVDGQGARLGETMTYALIEDIVQAVRNDPSFEQDQKLEEVTKLGADMIKTKPDNGAFGATLPNVILDNLPNDYKYNSSYGLFPFVTPEKAEELLKERAKAAAEQGKTELPGPRDIDFGKPKIGNTHNITNPDDAKAILNNDKFRNPLADDITKLTDGLGILLGFDKDSHALDNYLTISSFLTDKGALKRYSDFFRSALEKYIERYSKKAGSRFEVNYQDIINGAAAAWAAEILCGITLDKKNTLTTEDFFQKLRDVNDTLFGNVALQDKFSTLKRAKDATQLIRQLIEKSLEGSIVDPAEETFFESILHLLRELVLGEPHVNSKRSHDFLAKLAVSSRDRKELSANVLGFAVFTSLSFAQTLSTAVSFYMDDARANEREALKKASNDRVLGYVREAERLSDTSPIPALEALVDTVITLPSGETIELKKGDRIVIDPSATQSEDKTINPDRPAKASFLPFIEGTIPEAVKIIFGLKDIRQEKGNCTISYTHVKKDTKRSMMIGRKGVPFIQRIFDVIYVVAFIYLLTWAWNALGNTFDHLNTLRCSNPTHIRPWESYTMLPGPDNRTAPFIVALDNHQKRRITFVDIDERDMRFKVSVNGRKKALSSDFVLDKRVRCGEDVEQCLAKDFSTASVIISGGKKVIKLEWVGKDTVPGTNMIDWGADNARRFMWKQEAC